MPVDGLAPWFSLANKLLEVGYEIAGAAGPEIQRNDGDAGDIRLMAVSLISRSLSNMRGTLVMVAQKRLVEARVLARCIIENQFWLVGFANEPERFRQAIIDDDLNRRGSKSRTLFETGPMPDNVEKKLRQWMRNNKGWKHPNRSHQSRWPETQKSAMLTCSMTYSPPMRTRLYLPLTAISSQRAVKRSTALTSILSRVKRNLAETTGLGCFGLVNVLIGGCTILRSAFVERVDELAHEYLRLMTAMAGAGSTVRGPGSDER